MSMFIKVFAFAFIAMVINGFYTEVAFKEDKKDYITEELVSVDVSSRLSKRITTHEDGRVIKSEGIYTTKDIEHMSGQWNVKDNFYYSNICRRVSSNDGPVIRCDINRLQKSRFDSKWEAVLNIASK